ncbi:MAG: hypothetical protein OHK0047_40090 [Leptolyngbyaceae cyanobacterium]
MLNGLPLRGIKNTEKFFSLGHGKEATAAESREVPFLDKGIVSRSYPAVPSSFFNSHLTDRATLAYTAVI